MFKMELKETVQKILFVLFYNFVKNIKETIKQITKTDNLIIIFILIIIFLAGLYTDIKKKVIIYFLAFFFLILVCYRTYKFKKEFWLHEYKVIKGINWKDKLKEWKEENKDSQKEDKKSE